MIRSETDEKQLGWTIVPLSDRLSPS